ncbi:TPA: helix-turn-helix transcriptional regulator [Candidatus Scatousia excrementigallinarum]|uniref:Helix-turn-helix transcriptional regulator n=1 Tax=Candidatus Scatousia excrementigallinarum TaxID=2840935 RepID=A0A9D1F0F6_9BACT|nr:helix-turn-helix transcriptional regulator [Candidatus Scatousia excrementigallinarum]
MNIKKGFGKKIKELRLRLELTQEQFAEKIGISAKSLSQIELGKNFVSAEVLESICSQMNINPKSLFDFDYIETSRKNLLEDIIQRVSNDTSILKTIHKIVVALDE